MDHKLFDHTLLKADASSSRIKQICSEAVKYGFASVCVNSYYTSLAAKELAGTNVKVCTVVGFPLGQMSTAAKAAEAMIAVGDGAQEIDMVINIAALKEGLTDIVLEDIRAVRAACDKGSDSGDNGHIVLKVIIETCLLTYEEKILACQLAKEAGADFVKTSTGFSTGGATVEDVALMRCAVGDEMGVKASGGIHDAASANALVEAGATRLGTSATLSIISDEIQAE